jgi:hypothetical protein
VTTPMTTRADAITANRLVANALRDCDIHLPLSVRVRLEVDFAAALADQRETLTNAHLADLVSIRDECSREWKTALKMCVDESIAALTGGPTEKNS